MDPRSIKPGMAAASQMPLFVIHPHTGEMVTPMGWTKSGRPMFPVMGGAPDDDDAGDKDDDKDEDKDDDSEDDDEDSDEEDDDDSDDDDEDKGKKKGNAKAKIAALTEEKDRHFRKARKATKRAEAAESELAALKAKYEKADKGKGKAKDDDDDDKPHPSEAKLKEAEEKLRRQEVKFAFLAVPGYDWVKPEHALTLLLQDDDYDVEFDDDGTVDKKSLKAELKRFARENPHLLKPKPSKGDADGEDDGKPGATASQMNGNRKGKGKTGQPNREQLAKKFPALGRLG